MFVVAHLPASQKHSTLVLMLVEVTAIRMIVIAAVISKLFCQKLYGQFGCDVAGAPVFSK